MEGRGSMLEKPGNVAQNKAMEMKGWFGLAVYLVRRRIGSLVPHSMADLSRSSTVYPLSTQEVVAQCFKLIGRVGQSIIVEREEKGLSG